MLNYVNDIIKSVGTSKKKMITLTILLVFIGGFYVFKTIEFKNDCSPLIEQNEKLISKNVDIVNINSKLMDNNSLLMTNITKLEELLAHKDTVFIQIKVPVEIVSNRVVSNTGSIEPYSDRRVIVQSSAPLHYNRNLPNDEDTIQTDIDTDDVALNSTEEENLEELRRELEVDNETTTMKSHTKRRGFFKRLFGRKK